MASRATHRRRRPPRVDYTRVLSVELLASALDYLDQPDVLRTARVSKWWRAVAVTHPHYYRVIRRKSSPAEFVGNSSWSGHNMFHEQLDDVFQTDNHTAPYRVVVHLALQGRGYTREKDEDSRDALINILTKGTVPRLHALFPRIKALHLAVPDFVRPVIFDMLRRTAPVLESLSLEFTEPQWYDSDYEGDSDSESDPNASDDEGDEASDAEDTQSAHDPLDLVPAVVDNNRCLPVDLFSANAPRLRSIDLCAVRLGAEPIPALSRVRNAHIDFSLPVRSLGLTPAEHFPAISRLIIGIHEESISDLGLLEGSLALPASLSSFCIRVFYDAYVEAILEDVGISSPEIGSTVSTIELEMVQCDSRFDWASFLLDIGGSTPRSMRLGYPVRTQHHFFAIPSDIALSVVSTDGLVRTVHWTEPDITTREDAYNDDHYFTQFRHFARLRKGSLCASLENLTIAHAYLPALFALKALMSLRRLEIDLDVFEAPFWKTQATDESDDYQRGDRTPSPRPSPPPRRPNRPQHRRHNSTSIWYEPEYSDEEPYDDPWREDMDGIPQWYGRWESRWSECGLLNTFDEEEEKHTLRCPVLETVVLRTSYSYTEVNMRQLAHFGRALGLRERPAEKRPRLLLLGGVELSSAKYGTLHLEVFGELEKVPLPAVRFRPRDGPENHDPNTDYDDYISEEEDTG